MIYLLLLTLYISILIALGVEIKKNNDIYGGFFACFVIVSAVGFGIISLSTTSVIEDVDRANQIKAQIVLMKPLDKFKEDIAISEKELAKVERLIERAFDKNNPNVSVKMENGVKIYSLLGSSDLGSAEAGNAKKQELLMKYIEKQNEIADRLIYIRKLAYGNEYYVLQQAYAAYASSIFSGWLVRWFSVQEDYQPIRNQIYAPNS